ncbi:MAG: ThuA domain-containing protein [Verrucomicrobia bacterium]|nr:ThuA domain-containing protein [Verrucomicrobiota bacterium]MDA1067026.1 ThuA domain-containing protein [Verrucomicrobiota bacterium]
MRRIWSRKVTLIWTALVCTFSTACAAEEKKVLFLAGEPSHGWNAHEFVAGSQLLADCLNQSGLGISASVSEGWPKDSNRLKDISAIVLYTDGEDLHVAKGQTELLGALHDSGIGFIVLHYALEGADQEMNGFYLDSIGGYFEVDWSVNPQWMLENVTLADHPINSGVSAFLTEDEWYFHMRFREDMTGITPILSTLATEKALGQDGPRSGNPTLRQELQNGVPQHLAWATENPGKGRGFALTGGNFHHNWSHDDFRKQVLNGIAWTAGVKIPETGVDSKVSGLIKYQTISEAIARNDLEDVKRHLEKDPNTVNEIGKSRMTPLHEAIMRKRPEAALLLLAAHADPNIITSRSQTAMHLAIDRDLLNVAEAILDVGVDLNVRDSQGWTALHLAGAKNRNSISKLLLENGADVTRLSAAGGTPLHEAAVGGDAELIHLLLDAGIDPSIISDHKKTALDIAKEYENAVAIEILSKLSE